MGRRLYGRKKCKRSKASAAQKLAWMKRCQNEKRYECKLFDDITENYTDDSPNNSPENILTSVEDSGVYFKTHSEITGNTTYKNNSHWAAKTYEADNLIKKRKRSALIKEFGTISSDEYERIMNTPVTTEVDKKTSLITGNRIVNLNHVLQTALNLQYNHSKLCVGRITITDEKRHGRGLVSTVYFNCTNCPRIFEMDTENCTKTDSTSISTINTGAVWGTLATGSTYGQLEEFLSCMDIPPMPDRMFYQLENKLGQEWKSSLWRSMLAAGEKEKQHAVSKGFLCADGTPYITVYVDGSWSKRSYGTNFNSLSGMVGIVGRHTGELLFAAVRNKFCSICIRAEHKDKVAEPHVCYKNWNQSAPAMESDMVVEGFNLSQSMHGVKYCKFVADGDSSVFAKIKQCVTYGHEVKKIECTNHALKNYGLYKIKADTTINLQGRKLLKKSTIQLLTKRAKCSVYEHSKTEDQNITLLKEDLQNGLHHVFGDHLKCRPNICNNLGDQSQNSIPLLKSTAMYNHLYGK